MPPAARLSPELTVRAARSRGATRIRQAARDHIAKSRLLTDRVCLALPSPVSVNTIWTPKASGGLRLSDAYLAWQKEAGWRLLAQRPGRIEGRFSLSLYLPQASNIDLDNGIKVVCDLLQTYGVIRNDRDASRAILEWQGASQDALVEVVPFVVGPNRDFAGWGLPSREART